MTLVLVAAGAAGTAGVAAADGSVAAGTAQSDAATVTMSDQTTGGTTVVVDEVTLPDGGFVAIHDGTVTEGGEKTFSSVIGSSGYLSAGTHENVTVHLDEPVEEDGTLVAMPHQDTDGDHTYSFVASSGAADRPYTADGEVVIDPASVTASATVNVTEQPSTGASVVVDRVELAQDGFVTVHDSSLQDGATLDSVRGSTYLEAGVHEDVRVALDEPLTSNDTLIPMAHRDTNDNEQYDFVTSEGETDGPFVDHDGDIVLASAPVTVGADSQVTMADQASGGHYVTAESVFLPEGGFVTAHDSSVTDGATFDSVRGTSTYLEPGYHRDVGIALDEPLESGDTIYAMPHTDTNDNQQYDFVASEGEQDGPYTSDGDIVLAPGEVEIAATATFDEQASNGATVTVDRVDLPEDGFVTIHDASLAAGDTFGSVVGSTYLEAGVHEDVEVTLDEPLRSSQTAYAMPHRDTNGNGEYDFVSSDGEADGPFTQDGDIVLDPARVSVTATVGFSEQSVENRTVTVDSVTLHDGGFVTIHGPSLADGDALGSVLGTSDYLGPGTHENVSIELDRVPDQDGTFFAMPHRDTNGNGEYDFVREEGAADGPYTAAGDIVLAPAQVSVPGTASVSISDQASDGRTVVVDSVTMTKGGFLTIHDGTLLDGDALGSVRGTSVYLSPGSHENVEVTLDEPLEEEGAAIAMPHFDTNGNQAYDFVSSEGDADGPYTSGGEIVLADANVSVRTASVSISDQETNGETVVVENVALSEGGFVTIHDGTLLDGDALGSVRGTSSYLEAGSHSGVEVTLDEPLEEDGTVVAMPHLDTNDNQAYDFVSSEGDADGPYTVDGDIVLDDASATVQTMDDDDGTGEEATDSPTGESGPGFGLAVALVALLAAALLARAR
jgi:PGF-CTERM protein